MPSAAVYRQRRLAAAGGVAAIALLAGALVGAVGGDPEPAPRPLARSLPPAPRALPRGGRTIFPRFRVVAYYGAPQSTELGALGVGTPASALARLERQAKPYARRTRPVLPALELIASIANADPGEDGLYRTRQPDAVIARYLRAARRAKALLLLDIQPGRSDFFTEATRLERWLREPDVGLALDPEWRVREGEIPGEVIGHVEAREVNATTAWLAGVTRRGGLPHKVVIVHQFTDDMVDETALRPRDGLEIVLNADGFGTRAVKKSKYHAFTRQAPGFETGFKLFYEEDVGLMKPRDVLRMRPPPDFVVYE
jgi:hypothetical protein